MKTRLLLIFAFISFTLSAQNTNSLHEKSKAVLTCFEKGNFTELEKYYDETMKKEATAEKMKEFWTGLLQQYGPFVATSTISDSTSQQFRVVYINCIFQNSNIMMKTFLTIMKRLQDCFLYQYILLLQVQLVHTKNQKQSCLVSKKATLKEYQRISMEP